MAEPKKKIKELGKGLVKQIEKKQNPCMNVPIRSLSNVNFNPKKRILELGRAESKRYFFNVAHVKKFVQTTEVAATTKELLDVDKHLSLRQTFYKMRRTIPGTKIDIVDDQTESNQAVEDLELMTGLSREQLHINANKNGSVAGKIVIKDQGDTIDLSKLGSGGYAIPSNTEEIQFKKVNAKFILYMEKAAIWELLHQYRFWDKNKCIMIASQGQATRGIRRLMQRMNKELKLPVYVLVDEDIWGAYIYSVIKYGSISLAHESERLAIPSAKLIGLTADDVIKYDLKRHIIKFKDVDIRRMKQLRNYSWFKDNKAWQRQFKLMKELKGKVELDALVNKGISFMAEKYLPEKLRKKDFLD